MPKISIIVPVYNVEKYLSECLDSLVNQTLKDIEIILIDDGSSDESGFICNKYVEEDRRIKVIHQDNQGVSVARNRGIKSAKGKWITFVDGDDWIEKNTCEIIFQKAEEQNADIIIWSYFKNYANQEKELELIPGGDAIFTSNKDILELKSIFSGYGDKKSENTISAGTVWCKLYRHEFIKRNNLQFKKGLTRAQDTVFSLNAFEKASKIVYINKSLYHYRITNSSTCSGTKYIDNTLKPFNMLLDEFIRFIVYYNKGEEFNIALYARTIQVLMWHMKHKYFHDKNRDNILITRKKIKELILTEPYRSALKDVDYNMLSKKEKLMAKMYKKNMITSFYFIFKLHSIYENKRNLKYD